MGNGINNIGDINDANSLLVAEWTGYTQDDSPIVADNDENDGDSSEANKLIDQVLDHLNMLLAARSRSDAEQILQQAGYVNAEDTTLLRRVVKSLLWAERALSSYPLRASDTLRESAETSLYEARHTTYDFESK